MTFTPSPYQQAVFDFIQQARGSAVVIAVAGSGKTTTIMQALPLIPSSESVQLFAFNKAIADELKARIPAHCRNIRAATFHSVGYGALCRALNLKNLNTQSNKLRQICREKLSWNQRSLYEGFICRLVGLAKGEGVGALSPNEPEVWEELIAHHDLTLDSKDAREEAAINLSRDLLAWSNDAAEHDFLIDFDDQLYLPILWNQGLPQYDWVLVDEAQDTNPVRREFIARSLRDGGRLIAVGDPNQAIYGFTGASHDAIDLIKANWEAQELPLSVCYRCPRSVVEKAQEIVPQIEPAPDAPEGSVRYEDLSTVLGEFGPTDAILCRNTAPLIDLAYQCIGKGIGCQILGRDIGKGLQQLVEKMQALTIEELEQKLSLYERREIAKLLLKNQEAKAESIRDRVSCLFKVIDNLKENERTLPSLQQALTADLGHGAQSQGPGMALRRHPTPRPDAGTVGQAALAASAGTESPVCRVDPGDRIPNLPRCGDAARGAPAAARAGVRAEPGDAGSGWDAVSGGELNMVLLIGEGSHYTFHVLAGTREEAQAILRKRWRTHMVQTGADPDVEAALTINYIEPILVGELYRDYEAVKPHYRT
jgi:DNA helicase-2/ATP-dependent DNA helicase PcrA